MNYFILLEGMLVGLFFFSGLFSLFLALVNVEKKINLSFFIFAVFLGLGVLFNIIYLHTPSIAKYILHLKISAGFLAAAGISFVFLIAHITDYKPKVLKYAIVVGMTAVIVLNVISEYAFTWSHISEIKSTKLLWGDIIYQPVGEVSPALYFSVINILLLFVFAFLSTRQLIKSGDKIRGYFLIGTIGAGVLGILCNQIFLILWDIKLIVIDEIGYTGFIVLIAYINFKSVLQSYHIEQELKLNEVKFRTLVTGMNEAVIQVDNNDRVVFINEKFTEIMGYTLDELKGKVCNEIIAGESERDVIIDINKRRLKGLKNQYEISFYSKSGEKIEFLVSGTPVYDSDGKVMGSFGVMTDITSRKKAEEAIKLNEEKFRSFIEQSTNGFVLANHNGEIIEFNDAQEKLH